VTDAIGLHKRVNEGLSTFFTRNTERAWALSFVGISLYLLLLVGYALSALASSTGGFDFLNSAVQIMLLSVVILTNVLVIGVIFSAIYLLYNRLRWDWINMRPPYQEGHFIIVSPDTNAARKANKTTVTAVFASLMNFLYIIILIVLYSQAMDHKDALLNIVSGFRKVFDTSSLETFLTTVLRIESANLGELGFGALLGSISIILGFVFLLLTFANIAHLLRKGARYYLHLRREGNYAIIASLILLFRNVWLNMGNLEILLESVLRDFRYGELRVKLKRFLFALLVSIVFWGPVTYISLEPILSAS